MEHRPVLLKEVIALLDLKSGDTVLDATVGGGGHAREILKQIGESGLLVGVEQDEEILANLKFQISNLKSNVILLNGNFRDLDKLVKPLKIKKINAALFDLGLNSVQLENSGRGFSFQKDEPLLMTFKSSLLAGDLIAEEILNKWSEEEIFRILKEYGEERFAGRISRNIVRARPLKTTLELVEVIRKSVPVFYQRARLNFATKTFQALRVAVNDELGALEQGLEKVWPLIAKNGIMVVISFHSLEDRIVKNFFKNKKQEGEGKILTKKPIVPFGEELQSNPRSRSAKLRAIRKL